jgi:hypothetical protein
MGISLFGLTPAATYPALIKFGDNSAISGTLRALSDGLGNDLPIQVSNTAVNFTGTVTGIASQVSGVSGAIQFSNGSAFASQMPQIYFGMIQIIGWVLVRMHQVAKFIFKELKLL